jgi:hypothetical protein
MELVFVKLHRRRQMVAVLRGRERQAQWISLRDAFEDIMQG